MAKLELAPGESIVREEKGMWMRSKLRGYSGRLVLTDQRLVFAQTGIPWLGLIGLLFNKQGDIKVEVPRADLVGVAAGKHGFAKNVLLVKDRAGTEHKFIAATPVEAWQPVLGVPAYTPPEG